MKIKHLEHLKQTAATVTPKDLEAILESFSKQLKDTTIDAMMSASNITVDLISQVSTQAEVAKDSAASLKAEVDSLRSTLPEQTYGRLSKAVEQFEDAQRQKVSISISAIEKSIGQVLSANPKVLVTTGDFENVLEATLRGD